jgi:hypothetical protein
MLPQYKRYQGSLEKIYDGLIRHEDQPVDKDSDMANKYEPATCII